MLCAIKANGEKMTEHVVIWYSDTLLLDFSLMLAWHIQYGLVTYEVLHSLFAFESILIKHGLIGK